jgi:hypothetical protein
LYKERALPTGANDTQDFRFSLREGGDPNLPLPISADIYRLNSEIIKLTGVTTGHSVQMTMLMLRKVPA